MANQKKTKRKSVLVESEQHTLVRIPESALAEVQALIDAKLNKPTDIRPSDSELIHAAAKRTRTAVRDTLDVIQVDAQSLLEKIQSVRALIDSTVCTPGCKGYGLHNCTCGRLNLDREVDCYDDLEEELVRALESKDIKAMEKAMDDEVAADDAEEVDISCSVCGGFDAADCACLPPRTSRAPVSNSVELANSIAEDELDQLRRQALRRRPILMGQTETGRWSSANPPRSHSVARPTPPIPPPSYTVADDDGESF